MLAKIGKRVLLGKLKLEDFREDPLLAYVTRVLDTPMAMLAPPVVGVYPVGQAYTIVIHREGDEYQTELVFVPPTVEVIQYHTHPDVDSYEMHFAGCYTFECDGVKHVTNENTGTYKLWRKPLVPVPSSAVHGGVLHSVAAVFLSFQRWKNGVKPADVGSVGYNVAVVDHPNHQAYTKVSPVGRPQ